MIQTVMAHQFKDLVQEILAHTGESRARLAARLHVAEEDLADLDGPEKGSAWLHFVRRPDDTIGFVLDDGKDLADARAMEKLLLTFLSMRQPISDEMIEGARATLRRILDVLGLTEDQLGVVLGTGGGAEISGWLSVEPIPGSLIPKLNEQSRALDVLEQLFVKERIPQVIRREAELFDGRSALDLILKGKLNEVADKYDKALSYA